MFASDALSRFLGTLLLALAFSAFIRFVRGYRPAGVSAVWYDLVLLFIGLWLAFWPEAATFLREVSLAGAMALLSQLIATLLGGILGAGVAFALRRAMGEFRQAPRPRRRSR
ncbi:hypothetical protein LNN38_19050 [Pseudomonas sp. LA21]|uniref:hypothetical protein n=1 Tax=Pseudomonas sp. LA21 TaxID=2893373 RepID=UPI001FB78CAF|nr:hypothetical protein [Pseudomonas sp. LA21]MCJ1886966.1 hypothetical protein [Pseudomonas sp. LA21]